MHWCRLKQRSQILVVYKVRGIDFKLWLDDGIHTLNTFIRGCATGFYTFEKDGPSNSFYGVPKMQFIFKLRVLLTFFVEHV